MTLNDLYNVADKIKENLENYTNGLVIEYNISSKDLEAIDYELYETTNNDKPFHHTKVVNVTVNGIHFRLKEKQ